MANITLMSDGREIHCLYGSYYVPSAQSYCGIPCNTLSYIETVTDTLPRGKYCKTCFTKAHRDIMSAS